MAPIVIVLIGLAASNLFMTLAWYAHLKHLQGTTWLIAALLSWLIAFFEYLIQVPTNRYGFQTMTLPQLKILQEVVALAVFVPVCVFVLKEPVKLNYLWAGLCMVAAVYFVFRD